MRSAHAKGASTVFIFWSFKKSSHLVIQSLSIDKKKYDTKRKYFSYPFSLMVPVLYRKESYAIRVVETWNRLPDRVKLTEKPEFKIIIMPYTQKEWN
jgi:hypothetical protein